MEVSRRKWAAGFTPQGPNALSRRWAVRTELLSLECGLPGTGMAKGIVREGNGVSCGSEV